VTSERWTLTATGGWYAAQPDGTHDTHSHRLAVCSTAAQRVSQCQGSLGGGMSEGWVSVRPDSASEFLIDAINLSAGCSDGRRLFSLSAFTAWVGRCGPTYGSLSGTPETPRSSRKQGSHQPRSDRVGTRRHSTGSQCCLTAPPRSLITAPHTGEPLRHERVAATVQVWAD
jgi:hypothetical protein